MRESACIIKLRIKTYYYHWNARGMLHSNEELQVLLNLGQLNFNLEQLKASRYFFYHPSFPFRIELKINLVSLQEDT